MPPGEPGRGGLGRAGVDPGTEVSDELGIADAHPRGARPFARDQYVAKFRALAEGVLEQTEQDRVLDLVARLPDLDADDVRALTIAAGDLPTNPAGLF